MELRNVEVVEETDNHRVEYTLDVKVSVNPPEPDVGLGKTIDDYEVVEIVEIVLYSYATQQGYRLSSDWHGDERALRLSLVAEHDKEITDALEKKMLS